MRANWLKSATQEAAAGPHQALAGRRGRVVVGLQQALRVGVDVLAPQGVDLLARQVCDLQESGDLSRNLSVSLIGRLISQLWRPVVRTDHISSDSVWAPRDVDQYS